MLIWSFLILTSSILMKTEIETPPNRKDLVYCYCGWGRAGVVWRLCSWQDRVRILLASTQQVVTWRIQILDKCSACQITGHIFYKKEAESIFFSKMEQIKHQWVHGWSVNCFWLVFGGIIDKWDHLVFILLAYFTQHVSSNSDQVATTRLISLFPATER